MSYKESHEHIIFGHRRRILNSLASCIAIGQSYPAKDPTQVVLDPVAMGLLRNLCKECDLSIYVHSTWSQGRDAQYFRDLFKHYGFEPTVLDRVHTRDERALRIKQALQKYRPEKCIIFDDADMSKEFGEDFFFVDNRNGLSWEHYEKVLMRFGKSVPIILM